MGAPDKTTTFETKAEFSEYLLTLNKARLQDLCMERGLVPSHERRMMIRALEKCFSREQAKNVRVDDHKQLLAEKRKNLQRTSK